MPKFVNTLKQAELTSDPTADEGTLYYNSFTDEVKVKGPSTWSALGAATTTEMPTGSIITWVGSPTSPPSGWLFCNGSAVSRTTYSNLFGIISTYFGAGDGSTTFNLPDFRERSLVGAISANAGIAVANTSGGKVWAYGSLAEDPFSSLSHSTETWSHTHTISDDSQGSHTHASNHSTTATYSSQSSAGEHTHTYTATAATNGHSHTITGGLASSVGTISVNVTSATDSAAGTGHTHTVGNVSGGNSHTHTVTESVTTVGGHSSHTYTGSASSHTGSSNSSGAHTHNGSLASDSAANHSHSDHSANRARVWYLVKT